MKRFRRALVTGLTVLMVLLTAVGVAEAASGPWQGTPEVRGRLVAAVDATGALDRIPLGLQLELAPGWKTYWRSPGDAGLPPSIDWAGSANLAETRFHWPAPHRFTLFGLETFGYEGEVVFPIDVVPSDPGTALDLVAGVDLLVCSDICIPARLDLALFLPPGTPAPAPEANLIARYRALVPDAGTAAGMTIEEVRAVGGRPPALIVEARSAEPFSAPDLFVETDRGLAFAAPDVALSEGGRRAVLTMPLADGAEDVPLAGLSTRLTLVDGGRALEATAVATAAATRADTPAVSIVTILGLAVLGGFILNLMPCVLPVLSLKILSLVGHGGAAPGAVRSAFLASAAGVLFSFLVLATGAVALKSAGAAVGWGIQFQQPLFLVFMIVLLTVFACNLWGLFEISLPRVLADRVGVRDGGGGSLGGHFATGAFATLLATPCSAPFLGTAVGFALARGYVEIFAVFLALGLGMALPYLMVAAFPRLAGRLPRPGRWMVTLKLVLGVALALTALWLLTVLGVQIASWAAILVGGLMVAVAGALWVRRRLPDGRRAAAGISAMVFAAAAFAAPLIPDRPARAQRSDVASAIAWVPFDRPALRSAVAAGQVVFVDVTADWCITCQANKRFVLNRGEVARRFEDGGVIAMTADWTLPDDTIAAYLADFGRYGIPFNVVYGPGAPNGVILPELLTEDAVLAALRTASGA